MDFAVKNPHAHRFLANMSQIKMCKDCDLINFSYFSQNLHLYDFIVSNLSSDDKTTEQGLCLGD